MTSRRAPSAPPAIPGYTHVRYLGGGGFSDVFLYEQQWPRRRVAVKVLLADLLRAEARHAFDAEADLMAQVSSHPSIVTIYGAGVAADGRPFLVMEYCPPPSLNQRYRKEPFSVADALRIGIEVAGAVETAHRNGILHRDIKPANILVTEYGTPALTDFGISATMEGAGGHADGMSIPWSPPESFTDPPTSGVGTDVWALAATVYTLLAGRSPFELPGGANGGQDLIDRIERAPLPPIGRPDAPASLERILATAMAKAPASRYSSALALAREFQQVQAELGLSVTRAAVLDGAGLDGAAAAHETLASPGQGVGGEPPDDDAEHAPGTRIRRVRTIDPAPSPSRAPRGFVAPPPGGTDSGIDLAGAAEPPPSSDTVLRAAPASSGVLSPGRPDADRWGDGVPGASGLGVGPGGTGALTASGTSTAPVGTAAAGGTGTVHSAEGDDAPPPGSRRRAILGGLVAAALLVVAALAGAFLLGGNAPSTDNPTARAETAEPMDPIGAGAVPMPIGLTGEVLTDVVVFTWENPDPQDGDVFVYRVLDEIENGAWRQSTEATATVPVDDDGETCLEVKIVRSDHRDGDSAKACAP